MYIYLGYTRHHNTMNKQTAIELIEHIKSELELLHNIIIVYINIGISAYIVIIIVKHLYSYPSIYLYVYL